MKLFPYIFSRAGGGSIDKLDVLKQSSELENHIKAVCHIDEIFDMFRDGIVTLLYASIQQESDPRIQNSLLNLKRAVFNKRNLAKEMTVYNSFFSQKENRLHKLLKDYSQCYEKRNLLYIETSKQYQADIDSAIKNLDTLSRETYLSNGFLFASEKLSRTVGTKSLYKKQKDKTILTALKYLTRSVTKTTPFSTFNTVFCFESGKNGFNEMAPANESCINPSNVVYLFIKKLLIALPEAKGKLRLAINTSIRESKNNYSFFINVDNHDFLKRISKNPTCDFIKKAMDENPALNYDELLTRLQAQVLAPRAEVSNYLDKIIKEGFLLFQFPVSIYDSNWPVMLHDFIYHEINLKHEATLTGVAIFLEKLSKTKTEIASTSDPLKRKKYLISVSTEFSKLKKHLRENYPESSFTKLTEDVSPSDLYYEDSLGTRPINSQTINFEIFSTKLSRLRSVLACFDEKQTIRQSLRTILLTEFKAKPVALLTFLELYYNQKEKLESEIEAKLLESIQEPGSFYFKIIQKIESCTSGVLDLQAIIDDEPEKKINTDAYGLFAQVLENAGNPMLIINGESAGYGKNVSRFLKYFDKRIHSEFIKRLKSDHPEAQIVDVHDASIHNTNNYPSFTDYQVEVPGGERDPRATTKISLTDLFLIVENEDVILSCTNGRKILPFNFSMENVKRKSALIKFFDLFSVSASQSLYVMEIINSYFTLNFIKSEEMLKVLPRLLYDGNVVVQRRKWLVKRLYFVEVLALHADNKFSLNTYLKIAKWRIERHIPEEVFVKIRKRKGNSSYSSYKPQYINFEIPLLVICFVSLLEDADEIIEISEMLPGSEDIKENSQGNKCVEEFVLNYN